MNTVIFADSFAALFAAWGGGSEIEVTLQRRHDDELTLVVCDCVAVRADFRTILPPVGHTRRRSSIGFALVRQIATRHGGEVRCATRADDGTFFEVKLGTLPSSGDDSTKNFGPDVGLGVIP